MTSVTHSRLICVCLIVAVLCSSPVSSQTVSFTGRVIDRTTRSGVERAAVKIRETGSQASTDSSGTFTFAPLAPGRYTISVRRIAYAEAERTMIIESGNGGRQADAFVVELRSIILPADDVIIRSTRSSSAAGSSPYPLGVVNGTDAFARSAVTVSDAIAHTSGAYLVRDGAWETAVSIRGMSRSNIVMLVDDTRIETANDIAGALSLIDMRELERVEVLRSPGSSLYGSGALGGVIHLVTRRPSFSAGTETSLELAEGVTSVDDGVAHHLAVEHTGASHALRLSGGFRRAGNTMTPAGSLPNSRYTDFSIGASAGIATVGAQSLFVSYQRTQAQDTGIPGGAPFGATAAARYVLARRELLSLDYAMPNISALVPLVTVKVSRQSIDRNVEVIQSPDITLTPHATHTTSSVQVESKLCVLPDAVLTLGAEAWQRNLDSRRERTVRSTNTVTGERPAPASSYFSGGMYAHHDWHLIESRLTLALGARYDWIRVANDDVSNPEYVLKAGILAPSPSGALLWKKNTVHDGSWSANAGAVYALSPLVSVSCLAGAAFRSPSLEERFQFIDLGSLVRVGDPNLRPERSVSANGGLALHTDRLALRADVFLNSLTDLLTEIPGSFEGRPALVKTNIGEARLYGFEFTAELTLARWAALSTSISFVRGEDTRAHANLPQIAPVNGRTAVTFLLASLGTAEVASAYAVTQDLTAAGEARTPGFAVLDAGIAAEPILLRAASITLRAGVHNIFNAEYRNHLSTLRGLIRFEPGRNVTLSASVAV